MNWIGRSTVAEDAPGAYSLVEKVLLWLLSTPWWVPAILATGATCMIFLWLRPLKVTETNIIRHFDDPNIPYPLRDIGTDKECTRHEHSDGRVRFNFPWRLRCAPTIMKQWSDEINLLKTTRDYIVFDKDGDIKFLYDASSSEQWRKLSSVLGYSNDSPKLFTYVFENGIDKVIEEYNKLSGSKP